MLIKLLRNKFFALLLLAVTAILAYANSFAVPFHFDDSGYVVNNPIIRTFHYFFAPSDITSLTKDSPTALPTALRYVFRTRILGFFSLAVNYRLHGLSVVGYHIVNLSLHRINGWLVYLILQATMQMDCVLRSIESIRRKNNLPEAVAIISALLFVVHPVQTHAVTYISSRFVLQASFFFSFPYCCIYVRGLNRSNRPAM